MSQFHQWVAFTSSRARATFAFASWSFGEWVRARESDSSRVRAAGAAAGGEASDTGAAGWRLAGVGGLRAGGPLGERGEGGPIGLGDDAPADLGPGELEGLEL